MKVTRLRDCPLTLATLLVSSMLVLTGFAQAVEEDYEAMVKEVDELLKGQESIQKDLQEIRVLLGQGQKKFPTRQPEPFVEFDLDVSGRPFQGSEEARLVLVEFTDYQCPVCARHFRDIVPSFLEQFVEPGRVRYVVMHFASPLHRYAFGTASAAKCAYEQEKFWEMHQRLFEYPRELSPAHLDSHAQAVGLDLVQFGTCMGQERFAEEIEEDKNAFKQTRRGGTPAFALGWTDPDTPDQVRVVETFSGVGSYPWFRQKVQAVLSEDTANPQVE